MPTEQKRIWNKRAQTKFQMKRKLGPGYWDALIEKGWTPEKIVEIGVEYFVKDEIIKKEMK